MTEEQIQKAGERIADIVYRDCKEISEAALDFGVDQMVLHTCLIELHIKTKNAIERMKRA